MQISYQPLVCAVLLFWPGALQAAPDTSDPRLDEPGERDSSSDQQAAMQDYFGLSLAQDFLLYGSEPAVCPSSAPDGTSDAGAAEYRCQAAGEPLPRPVYGPAGNEISGGIGAATTRVMLGYDRLLGSRLLLGARLGYAFGGGPEFLPLHAELRGALLFGGDPRALRIYALAAAGLAQIAGRVPLEIYVDEAAYASDDSLQVDAWRKAGNVFAALGLGAALPTGPSSWSAELRLLQLFGTSGTALSLGIGYAYGL